MLQFATPNYDRHRCPFEDKKVTLLSRKRDDPIRHLSIGSTAVGAPNLSKAP
jgi:hypothetical protein